MAHTPGPWEIYRQPIAGAEDAAQYLIEQVDSTDPISDTLFLINAGGKCPAATGCGPTSEANAYLVAAAPDLLIALEDFDNWFCGFDPEDQASRMEGRKVIIRARAAIAKARGQ